MVSGLIVAITAGALVGIYGTIVIVAKKLKKTPQVALRQGVIKMKIKYKWDAYSYTTDNVTVIVSELERIASQSRIRVDHVDDAYNERGVEATKRHLGDYVATSDVEWDDPSDTHDEIDKLISKIQRESNTPVAAIEKELLEEQ